MATNPKRKKAAKKRASRKKPVSRTQWTPSERLLSSAARIVGEERARTLARHAGNERGFLRAVVAEAPARSDARRPSRRGPPERYVAAADQLPFALFVVDPEERFTYVNRAAEILTGRSGAELVGRSVAEALGEDVAGEESLAERLSVIVRRARSGGRQVEYEIAYALPAGAHFDVGFTASLVSRPPLHREESDVVVVGRDLHTPGEGIRLRQKSALSAEAEADLRRSLRQAERQMARSERLMAIGQMAAGFVHEINNPLGALQGLVQLLQADVDERGPASEVLADVADEIEHIERIADSMLELARSSAGEGAENFAPVDVVGAIESVLRLVEPQLRVKRVKVGREFAFGDTADEARSGRRRCPGDAARSGRRRCPGDAARSGRRRCPGDAAWVFGDPDRLQQVLMNVILNASQAMSPEGAHLPGGGKLTIRVLEDEVRREDLPERPSRAEDIAGGEDGADALAIRQEARRRAATAAAPPWREGMKLVRIEIEDTGPGISEEVMGRIFEPFFTTKSAGEGTGLGLSTSEAIVRAHGGAITAENVEGAGARFTVRLPACERPGG